MNENVGIDAINFSLPRLSLPIEDLHQRKLESPISKTSGFSLKKIGEKDLEIGYRFYDIK